MAEKTKPNWSRIGKNNRTKGKFYERHVCQKLAERLGVPPEELYGAVAGLTGDDAKMSRAARRLFPWSVETKNAKNIQMPAWLAQAKEQSETTGYPPALIFKFHGKKKDYICLELDEFLDWVF